MSYYLHTVLFTRKTLTIQEKFRVKVGIIISLLGLGYIIVLRHNGKTKCLILISFICFSNNNGKITFLCCRELMEHGGTNVRQPQTVLKNTQILLLVLRIL